MKQPKTMRERARALAQECVLFGKMRGSQWEGLTELFVAFAENEIRALGVDGGSAGDAHEESKPAKPKNERSELTQAVESEIAALRAESRETPDT